MAHYVAKRSKMVLITAYFTLDIRLNNQGKTLGKRVFMYQGLNLTKQLLPIGPLKKVPITIKSEVLSRSGTYHFPGDQVGFLNLPYSMKTQEVKSPKPKVKAEEYMAPTTGLFIKNPLYRRHIRFKKPIFLYKVYFIF